MQSINFEEVIEGIVQRDPRYPTDAYFFLRDALDFTQNRVIKEAVRQFKRRGGASQELAGPRHVSGPELMEGLRDYALDLYGPMAITVFEEWNIRTTGDFGEIVFNMIEVGLLSKTDNDQITDFQDIYDFDRAFRDPFLPEHKRSNPSPAPKKISK